MNELFEIMSYEEFKEYCYARACDGKWDAAKAFMCINVMLAIDSINIKFLGITLRRKTERAREKAWREIFRQGGIK